MKERVVFEANVPVTATLAYPDGLKVQGRFGDQVMYSLTDGRVMYVSPIVRDKPVELGIRQHEPFAICWGRFVSVPLHLSVNTLSGDKLWMPSSWRSVFWSTGETRTYATNLLCFRAAAAAVII